MLHVTKKKLEFSKKIFIGVTIITLSVTIFTLIMIWRTNDLSPLMYLIPAVFAEMGAATGFYFNKAKAENEIKIREGMRGKSGVTPESEEISYE
jgi:hypothetical protein